jgi:hypothetical protein
VSSPSSVNHFLLLYRQDDSTHLGRIAAHMRNKHTQNPCAL